VDTEDEIHTKTRESRESEMLKKAQKEGHEYVATLAERAEKEGPEGRTLVQLGRVAPVCLEVPGPGTVVFDRDDPIKKAGMGEEIFRRPVDELRKSRMSRRHDVEKPGRRATGGSRKEV